MSMKTMVGWGTLSKRGEKNSPRSGKKGGKPSILREDIMEALQDRDDMTRAQMKESASTCSKKQEKGREVVPAEPEVEKEPPSGGPFF